MIYNHDHSVSKKQWSWRYDDVYVQDIDDHAMLFNMMFWFISRNNEYGVIMMISVWHKNCKKNADWYAEYVRYADPTNMPMNNDDEYVA